MQDVPAVSKARVAEEMIVSYVSFLRDDSVGELSQ